MGGRAVRVADPQSGIADQLAAIVDRLDALAAELRGVRLLVDRGRPDRDPADADALAAILGIVGAGTFTARAVADHAQLNPTFARTLRAADVVSLADVAAMLRRHRDALVQGARLERHGRGNTGAVWRFRRVTE